MGASSMAGATEIEELPAHRRIYALQILAKAGVDHDARLMAAFARVPHDYPFLFGQGPDDQITFPGEQEPAPAGAGSNVFFVSPDMGAALLGTTPAGLAQYQQAVAAAGKPVAPAFQPGPASCG